MTKTPQELLKKLKPTKAYELTEDCIRGLAKFAVDSGEDAFAAEWKKQISSKAPPKKKTKVEDPTLNEALKIMSAFTKSRKLTSGEAATGILNFAANNIASLPKPTQAAQKGVPASIRWISSKASPNEAKQLVSEFIEQFSD